MHDGVTAVYKSNVDLFFCVLGAQNENEVREVFWCFIIGLFAPPLLQLMLVGVLNALYDSINSLLKYVFKYFNIDLVPVLFAVISSW